MSEQWEEQQARQGKTYKVVHESDALVEVDLGHAKRRRLQGVVDGPEGGAGGVADSRCAVGGDAVRFTAQRRSVTAATTQIRARTRGRNPGLAPSWPPHPGPKVSDCYE